MDRTPTTDDKLIGREIRREFGRQRLVLKTGWPVVHVHFPNRLAPTEVGPYLQSWAKTKAFWSLYEKVYEGVVPGSSVIDELLANATKEANRVVTEFATALSSIARTEMSAVGSDLASTIMTVAGNIAADPTSIVAEVVAEIKEFEQLKRFWPTILQGVGAMDDIWTKDNNFAPALSISV